MDPILSQAMASIEDQFNKNAAQFVLGGYDGITHL
jgi:hypothetical protein